MPNCPISLPCILEPFVPHSKRLRCVNLWTCLRLSYSWILPYEYDPEKKCLYVTVTPTKLYYNTSSETYEYKDYDDPYFKAIIREEWEKAGWARPVINKNYPDEEDPLIPF